MVKAMEDQVTEAGVTDGGFQAELRSRSQMINGRHSVSICWMKVWMAAQGRGALPV